ncbi:GAF and ANTAR domain-containing protein [Haloactinomyces albus]|uniref:Transcriptional regulator with GAF, ATPase, and Fis domain n=1 Tax=Haloactinomyces albus TaxID=1352928 RepID=A0AAE3Z8F3_9ACTN|nr:GAF and ANTAR domain-containing protein [Haloactinomyces albus]MDR7300272.1 transcriptional regulator with GAF, ATPase, and Fis domain [Haloactinomyces albus]
MDDVDTLASSLAHVSRDLLAQSSAQATLNKIVEHTVELIDGCDDCGLLLMRAGGVESPAQTSDRVRKSDQAQAELGEGPCFDAAREGTTYRVDDMAAEDRWPRYAPRARELGIASMMGFQLFTSEDTLGALNLYSNRANAFTERSRQVGWIFASHAAMALSTARMGEQLETTVETRRDIGEAMGIVTEQYRTTHEDAFGLLQKSAQDYAITVREAARIVTRTGELPRRD